MNKIVKKKLRDFAKRHSLKPEHQSRLAASLGNASAAQAEAILRKASTLLLTTRLVVRPTSPILGPDGRPQEAATEVPTIG